MEELKTASKEPYKAAIYEFLRPILHYRVPSPTCLVAQGTNQTLPSTQPQLQVSLDLRLSSFPASLPLRADPGGDPRGGQGELH